MEPMQSADSLGSEDILNEAEQIFTVKVTAEFAEHSDGVNAHYVFQAYANNREVLPKYRGEGNHLAEAATNFAHNVRKPRSRTTRVASP